MTNNELSILRNPCRCWKNCLAAATNWPALCAACARRNVLTTQLTANSFCRTLQKIADMYDLLSLTLVSIVYRQYKPQSNSLLHHKILNSGSLCWLTLTGYSRPPVGDIMQHAHCINWVRGEERSDKMVFWTCSVHFILRRLAFITRKRHFLSCCNNFLFYKKVNCMLDLFIGKILRISYCFCLYQILFIILL